MKARMCESLNAVMARLVARAVYAKAGREKDVSEAMGREGVASMTALPR